MINNSFKEVFNKEFVKTVQICTGCDMIEVIVIDGETFNIPSFSLAKEEDYKEYIKMKITNWDLNYGIMRIFIKEGK